MMGRLAQLAKLAALYKLGLIPDRYEWGGWLRDFNRFWYSIGCVPFKSVDEFEVTRHFLAQSFKASEQPMPGTNTEAALLWRDDVTLCHLFSFIARREQHPLRFLRWMRWLPWHGTVLEFGAGAAPLADALDRAWPFPAPDIVVADIDWHLHDYQKWRFEGHPHVTVMTLPPAGMIFPAGGLFDGILCTETLEHVPDPLQTARQLMGLLKPGGVLIADYGNQTKNQPLAPQGLTARAVTINYLKRAGKLLKDGDGEEFMVIKRYPRHELHKQEVA
jgi:SAM-dependent methyltransferase